MADSIRTLEREALKLSEKDRAELARILLLSLEDSEDQETELVWAKEAERRYQELLEASQFYEAASEDLGEIFLPTHQALPYARWNGSGEGLLG